MDRSGDITFTVRKKELELEKLRMQIADLEKTIARPADENIRHYTAFEFFKGFLIASFIVTAVLALPTILYVQISNFLYKAGEYDYSYPELKAILFLAGIFALIHLIGGFVARKRRDANNASADNAIESNLRRKEALKKELEDLREQYRNNLEELERSGVTAPTA